METLFERLLREKLQIMMEIRIQNLTVVGVADYAAYRSDLGYLEALRHVLAECDTIRDEMRK